MNAQDRKLLIKIIQYIDEIALTVNERAVTLETLFSDVTSKNAISMCIIQIGELVTHLSDDFKETHTEIIWKEIKAMRNVAAHHYGEFNMKTLWETVTDDMPVLKSFCTQQLSEITQQKDAI
ncbi:MAG: DUF86 domain-containing protein [Oscillospiraceae bacterium]|jgi:uncharacterized protein with HEPN domain|nr:DUF86 domain-containing protein [Oscillospiraceae bacterium]